MNQNEKSIFPLGEDNIAYAKYFIGKSYLKMLSTEQVVVANVTFEPVNEKEEMAELITHIAFYAGWPKAWAAMRMAKEI